jgi:hypothetical protein
MEWKLSIADILLIAVTRIALGAGIGFCSQAGSTMINAKLLDWLSS